MECVQGLSLLKVNNKKLLANLKSEFHGMSQARISGARMALTKL
jgi:hypothetical protein